MNSTPTLSLTNALTPKYSGETSIYQLLTAREAIMDLVNTGSKTAFVKKYKLIVLLKIVLN